MSYLTLNVKFIRERSGFSRLEVATLLGISLEEYTAIEEKKKKPTMEIIVKLSHICHTTCDELIGFQPFDRISAERVMEKNSEETHTDEE